MTEVDGSQKSGSGTIVRTAIALAAVTGQPLHIFNIRQNRPQPGLKPQHLEAVSTAARLCDAQLKGATLNSGELWFIPGKIHTGRIEARIGTAGSIPMLIMTVLPICITADKRTHVHITDGGTDVQHSPTINYMRYVFLRLLKIMGVEAEIAVQKYGYYPKGMGEVTLTVQPTHQLRPLTLETFGKITDTQGLSTCTFLEDRKVAERQANAANEWLARKGLHAQIQVVNDRSNHLQKGSSITLWSETDKGVILGADAIGELRKSSEKVGEEAALNLWTEISARPTVDNHGADMLIPYVAMAQGRSVYYTRNVTEHLETNIWLAQQILNMRFNIEQSQGLVRIQKANGSA